MNIGESDTIKKWLDTHSFLHRFSHFVCPRSIDAIRNPPYYLQLNYGRTHLRANGKTTHHFRAQHNVSLCVYCVLALEYDFPIIFYIH